MKKTNKINYKVYLFSKEIKQFQLLSDRYGLRYSYEIHVEIFNFE